MPLPNIIPWEPSHVPQEIQAELRRRQRNISLNFVGVDGSSFNPTLGPTPPGQTPSADWFDYRGPMTAWVRMCSNGRGRPSIESDPNKVTAAGEKEPSVKVSFPNKRFVFFGGKDFQSTYGFKTTPQSPNTQIIGYKPSGEAHIIDNQSFADHPIHVPSPEIVSVETHIQKEVLRRCTVEWVCFSWKQLEYMTPYFLVPGISIMLEFGWNHFNPNSLVDIANDDTMRSLFANPYPLYEKNIIDSHGNYDVIYGTITNFNWSVEGNNRYVCSTEITSKNRLYAGLPIRSELFVRDQQDKQNKKKSDADKTKPAKTMGNLGEFINDSNLIQNFRRFAREGTVKFFKNIPEKTSYGLIPVVFGSTILPIPWKVKIPETVDYMFFKDMYDKTVSIQDEEKRQIKLSYLYGVFDGRDATEKKESKAETDFDNGGPDKTDVWFSMGLITTLLNIFSERSAMTSTDPMFELDIDDVIIGAHPNLISANKTVLIPNKEAPKYFWGRHRGRRTITDLKKNPDYMNQYVYEVGDSTRPADIILRKVLDQGSAARDDIDVWINRNVYRLNPKSVQSDEDPNYKNPERGKRAFPNGSTGEPKPCGYLRDIYFSIHELKALVNTPHIKTYYDLVQAIISRLNQASADFWDLRMVDNGLGKWTIADSNFASYRNGKKGSILTFDMHDVNNIVKSLKFRPQMTDTQATRVLYGEVSNPNSQFYSKDEIESMNFIFKDSYMFNDYDDFNKSSTAANMKLEELWQSLLTSLQVVDQNATDTLQMKILRSSYLSDPPIETDDKKDKKFRYIKLALPSNNGYSILKKLLDDQDYNNNPKYCAIQPGINAEVTLQGIGGLRTFQCFLIKNLPEPYSEKDVVFQILNVVDRVEAGNWETTIVAGLRPLRSYIRDTLGITSTKANNSS